MFVIDIYLIGSSGRKGKGKRLRSDNKSPREKATREESSDTVEEIQMDTIVEGDE
ncbi:hypothetical protein LR48_Vigan03g035100 [Vigna angularis]|uniref:Uncharacterized protein n=1 Tax=Phaseolus angularis TaxID=3914 RepID=A0A0L9U2G9_PHAAN|nr:hypothetical protein LR48_Vigan03g035100 [Vigna angularis]